MDSNAATDDELLAQLAWVEVERARLEACSSSLMVQYSDRCRERAAKHTNLRVREIEASVAADELALVVRQPTRLVQNRLFEARFAISKLPGLWAAHQRGEVDGFRVHLICEQAAKLAFGESLIRLDERVISYAESHTCAQLRAWLRRFVAKTEPEGAERRRRRAHADRSVWIQHDTDGISWLHAQLSTTDAWRIDRLLSSHGARLATNNSNLSLEQARSDALAELLLRSGGTPSKSTGSGAVIGVTIPLVSLAGHTNDPGVSFDGQFALPASLIRELACEPGTLFYRLLTDPLGRILDVTELGRFPSRKLRIAVQARDGTCTYPTCSRPAIDCDLDHEIPHPRGPTSGTNLKPRCRRHHRQKGHGLLPDGEAVSTEQLIAGLLVEYQPI